jgi:tRNA nucleotidyltransferase/poly(A) polymerase
VTAVSSGTPFEVTTLRRDVSTDGRRATVAFTTEWSKDAARRDFTINALYAAEDGQVFDYFGGIADLKARRVRFVGDPTTRIREDYLRILRFFRFHACYGEGAPDPAGLTAVIVERAGLERLSRERVRMELMKLLLAPRAVAAIIVMAESGLIGMVLGGVPYLASLAGMAQREAALGLAPNWTRRLGALGAWIVEDAERLAERLRLSNVERETLGAMASAWWRVSPGMDARALLYRLGPDHFTARALLAWSRADAEADEAAWRALATLPQRWTAPTFPLRAADFLARGLEKGPALGAALGRAEEAWIAAGFPTDRRALDAIADATR